MKSKISANSLLQFVTVALQQVWFVLLVLLAMTMIPSEYNIQQHDVFPDQSQRRKYRYVKQHFAENHYAKRGLSKKTVDIFS